MELSSMLAYQAIDKDLAKLESEFSKTECVRDYTTGKKAMQTATAQVVQQEAAAADLVKQMEAMIAEYDALEKELKESEDALPEVEDLAGADFFSRNVQKLLQQLKTLSAEITRISNRIVELNQAHANTMAAGKAAKQKVAASKDAYNAELAKVMPAVEELKAKLAEAAKSCTEHFLSEYRRIKKIDPRMPVVVPLSGFNCGGCFMEMSGDALSGFGNESYVVCPNCGRFVYKQ